MPITPSIAELPPQLFKDDQLLVINKPAGLIVEDAHTHSQATLEHALPQDDDLDRNGLVHRLDKDTSGVMLVAQTPEAQANLQQQFKDRTVTKQYTALVWGKPKDKHFIIDAPIARHPMLGYKYVAMEGGRLAKTEVWLEKVYIYQDQPVSLLRIQPYTGRTHQIRVHLAAMRLPIIGDKIYGRRKDNSTIRQFLHATSIKLTHPTTGQELHFEAPLADDLADFLSQLTPAE
jgi:23S rRNA pseudouridine1911/1915/1917 synthase